eukprot:m.3460 g.3460  ORF g.3460 m.3460 type:complete len:282 (+) comp5402_c0_seq2:158-1003(+)
MLEMAESEAELVCTTCDTQCQSLAQLKRHERKHSGAKPFQCSYCGKGFAQKGNLTVHVRTHTGLKPFQCDVCNKAFTTSSYLKYHRQLHDRPNSRLWVANRGGVDTPLDNRFGCLRRGSRDRPASLSSVYVEGKGEDVLAAKRAKSCSPPSANSAIIGNAALTIPVSLATGGILPHPMLAMAQAQPMLLNMNGALMPPPTMAVSSERSTSSASAASAMPPTLSAAPLLQAQAAQQMAMYMMAQFSAASMMQSCMQQAAVQQQQQQQQVLRQASALSSTNLE